MKAKFALLILVLNLSNQAFGGGNELGNGGDVFFCPAKSANQVMMVDIYEALLAGRKLDFGPKGLNYREKVKYVLHRWAALSPLRVERYLEWLEQFDAEAKFISGVTLPNIADEGIVAIPDGCEIRQIAIQLADADLGTSYTRYTISKDLWDLLDEDNRAALVLHEIIFREAIIANQRVSIRVRHLNTLLWSQASMDEYIEASKNFDGLFLEWRWGGISFISEKIKSYYFGSFRTFRVDSVSTIGFDRQTIDGDVWLRDAGIFVRGRGPGWIEKLECSDIPCLVYNVSKYGNFDTSEEVDLLPQSERYLDHYRLTSRDHPVKVVYRKNINHEDDELLSGLDWLTLEKENELKCSGISSLERSWKQGVEIKSSSNQGQCQVEIKTDDDRKVTYHFSDFHSLTYKGADHGSLHYTTDGKVSRDEARLVELGQGKVASCLSKDMNGEEYQCSGIPAQLNCLISDPNDYSSHELVTVTVKDPSRLLIKNGDTYLYLPAGQVVSFKKAWFIKTEIKLANDDWVSISEGFGECYLHYNKN